MISLAKKQTSKKQTSKGKTTTNTTLSLQTNIVNIVIITLCIITIFSLGIVGEWFFKIISYLFGVFIFPILLFLIWYYAYAIYTQEWFNFKNRKFLSINGIIISLMIIVTAMSPTFANMHGFESVSYFLLNFENIYKVHGLFSVFIYATLSSLFAKSGTLFIAFVILITCLVIVFYNQLKKVEKTKRNASKKNQKKSPSVIDEEEDVIRVKSHVVKEKRKKKIFDFEEEVKDSKEDDIFEYGEVTTPAKRDFNINVAQQSFDDASTDIKETSSRSFKDFSNNSSRYTLPEIDLLTDLKVKEKVKDNVGYVEEMADRLIDVMKQFGITCNISNVNIGPTVTRYEVKLAPGTRVSRVSSLQDDIKMALAAKDIRIEAPIPGKNAVGIEIPNIHNMLVSFKEILLTMQDQSILSVVLGKDINGKPVTTELNKMPHLLVAGATGSGKSVCINTIIMSILMRCRPDQVKLVLIDPKKVELSGYNGIPHLLTPVVTNPKKASVALRRVVEMMEERYELFARVNVKNIEGYQNKTKDDLDMPDMPYIVTIIDELADLMMVSAKEVEESIMRITQMARAAGIHLIVATQRPSTDVITGVIKANIPSRIAFAVSSGIDSRTILDSMGAERLLGKGDMLFLKMGESSSIRIQGAFISDEDVNRVCHDILCKFKVDIEDQLFNSETEDETLIQNDEQLDELYSEVLEFVRSANKASTSLIQRRFRIGYNRAARLIDQLEDNGVVGPANGSKPREVFNDE